MAAIEVKNLSKKYRDIVAIDNLNFHVDKGEVVGFLGPNGAGKTTTMKILTCYMPATSGEAKVAGHDCYENNLAVRRKIGYLPESCPLYTEMNVWEYLAFIASLHQLDYKEAKTRIKGIVYSCGLEDKIYSDIAELSKGYKQRVGLAQALINDPEILILDEPTTGLDPNQRIEIKNLIKNIGSKKTVLLSSHILPEVEATCNRVIIINKGKIVAEGSPEELESKAKNKVSLHIIAKGKETDIKSILEKVKGINAIEAKGLADKNEYAFEIFIDSDLDLRKIIMEMFGRSKSTDLLEIYKREITLEDVFTEVTKE